MTKRDDRFERLLDSAEKVLGPIEDMHPADVTEILETSGIDADALDRRMYEKLSEIVGRYYSRNQNVPNQLARALDEFRPPDTPTADPATAAQRAQQWVAKLLAPKPLGRRLQVGYSFRNRKGDLPGEDSAVLESLADELRRNIERED